MAATTGHSINTGPYGENTEICSSLKLLHWLNLKCASILYKLCVFYFGQNSKMTTTAGHSFYIGPIGSFYNQVNDTGSWEPLVVIIVCDLFEWKQICADLLSLFIKYINVWNPVFKSQVYLDPINRFNHITFLCLSQARTWISNIICCGLFFALVS